MQIHLFVLVCLMSIQILRHFLANSTFAKSKGPWCDNDGAIEHRFVVIISSQHRHRVTASSPSYYRGITQSLHRTIAFAQWKCRNIMPSSSHHCVRFHRHHIIVLSSSHYRDIPPSTCKCTLDDAMVNYLALSGFHKQTHLWIELTIY